MGVLIPYQQSGSSVLPAGASQDPNRVDLSDYCARRLASLETGEVPNIGPGSAAAIWALVSLSTVFLGLRIYCKIWRSRGIWWDDLVLILSWIMFVISAVMCQRVIDLGFGKYPCDIPLEHLPRIAFEGAGLGSAFTIFAIVWSKTSFGITILRLTYHRLRWMVLILVIAMNVAMCLQAIFVWIKCDPVEKNWRPMVPGRCWDLRVSNGYAVFSGVLSGVCDIFLALLPWYLVWDLHMRKKEKVGVIVAMSMGVFAGATSFVKSAQILDLGSKDFTHDGCHLITWAAAEIATTIMASCIPVLRVLFRELRDTTLTETTASEGRRYYQYQRPSGTGETAKGTGKRPTDATVPDATHGKGGALQKLPNHGGQEAKTVSKPWGSFWDLGKRARKSSMPLAEGPTGTVPAAPYIHVDNSSQRVLVHVSGQSTPGEVATRTAGVILQTQEFEIKYEGWSPRESAVEYELNQIGEARLG